MENLNRTSNTHSIPATGRVEPRQQNAHAPQDIHEVRRQLGWPMMETLRSERVR